MKNLLVCIATCLAMNTLLAQEDPDLKGKPTTLSVDTTGGWKLMTPVVKNKGADFLNFHGMRDPDTGDTTYSAYPDEFKMYAKNTGDGYTLFLKDTTLATTDTLHLYLADSTFRYCTGCDIAFSVRDFGLPMSERIRITTNSMNLEGHRFLYGTKRDPDLHTLQLVRRDED